VSVIGFLDLLSCRPALLSRFQGDFPDVTAAFHEFMRGCDLCNGAGPVDDRIMLPSSA
jgi:hypothetical protein